MPSPAVTRLQVFVGTEGFGQIKTQWSNLAQAHGSHFLHFPGWYEAQLKNQSHSDHICFLAVFVHDNQLTAVLPFERVWLKKGKLKLPILQLYYPNEMGVNDVVAQTPLREHRQAIQNVLREQLPWFAYIRWQCVLARGWAATFLKPTEQPRVTHHSKFIEFPGGAEAFWATHSSKFRKGLQKKLRKAEQQSEVRLLCETRAEALPEVFEQFLEVEDSGWKGESGTSVVKQPAKLAYYRSLLSSYGEQGLCQINILYFGQEPVAAQFGVKVHDTLYLLKIGYKEAYREVSPGHLLLYQLVNFGAQNKAFNRVSFVTGVDWIDRWHPKLDPVGIFYSSSGSWLSGLSVCALRTALAAKRKWQARSAKLSTAEDAEA